MANNRRATDRPPLSDIVTKGNLDDRLEIRAQWARDHEKIAEERWSAHRHQHEAVAESLREYKTDANEWRRTLSDLRGTFIPKAEFLADHRTLEATLRGEIEKLSSKWDAMDVRLDGISSDLKDLRAEQLGRRSLFSDSRNVLTAAGVLFGIIASMLLIVDRLP